MCGIRSEHSKNVKVEQREQSSETEIEKHARPIGTYRNGLRLNDLAQKISTLGAAGKNVSYKVIPIWSVLSQKREEQT